MSTDLAYVPCRCPRCREKPVYGVCRCRVCQGATLEELRQEQGERQKDRVVALLRQEDGSGLSDEEARELERLLFYLTRN